MAQKILHMLEEHDPERLIALPEIDYEPGTSVVRDLFVASLRDLLTGARLNDDIMNLYMVQLTLLDTVSSSVEAEDRRLRSKRVFKTISSLWVSPDVRKKDLNLEGEVTLLWPLFHGYSTEASNHWTLLEIHAIPAAKRKNKASEAPAFTLNLRHYDSLNWKISSLTGLPSALKYLSTQFKTHLILQDVQSWPTPQQSNLKDCGVFVLHMAKRLVLGLPVKRETPVNSELLRAQIAVELLGRTIMIPKFKHVK